MDDLAPDLPRTDLFRFTASFRVHTREEGGRVGPVASSYRPDCWFGRLTEDGERELNGCVFHLRPGGDTFERDGSLWVPPGGHCVADVVVRYPSYVRDLLRVGGRFDVQEGLRVVGSGEVLSIFDPGPEHDGPR